MPDRVHMCIAIPPKHAVAPVIGFLKGKSAIAIARLCRKERNFSGADGSGEILLSFTRPSNSMFLKRLPG
jgi:REP element-mobilizing transposase RayT